jgi:hypothetical protein
VSEESFTFDEYGLIVQDPPSLDGGDSCNRMGQYYTIVWGLKKFDQFNKDEFPMSTSSEALMCYLNLTDDSGMLRRHKAQVPWNNPANCTRDQMNPMWIALALHGYKHDLFEQARNMLLRFGFYQNFERDYPGTKKSLFPQFWKKGERFDDRTIIEKDQWRWHPDFADIAMPNDWNIFIRGLAHNNWFRFLAYPFVLIGDLFFAGAILAYVKSAKTKKIEPNQLHCAILQNYFQIPTVLSRWAIRYYFRKMEWSEICAQLNWYFGGRGGCDSPQFAREWILLLYWLRHEALK